MGMHGNDGHHEAHKGHEEHGHGHHHEGHGYHHHHDHHHHDRHEESCGHGEPAEAEVDAPLTGVLTERVKLVKIMEHWIHHNEEHARSYEEWAHRAEALGETETASLLGEVARDTRRHGQSLQEALTRLSEPR